MIPKACRAFALLVIAFTCIAPAKGRLSQEAAGADEVGRVSVDELILLMAKKAPVIVIDVRGTDSYDTKIKGAIQIPLSEIEERLKQIPKDKEIITYCA